MLSDMLKKMDEVQVAGEFEDALSAVSAIKKSQVDILFLDVEMPGMSGLELLKVLPEKPLTILVTAQPSYAVEAFELNVMDYLVKPFAVSRVIAAVERAIELLKEKKAKATTADSEYIFIKDRKTIRQIRLKNILWLEAKGDYVKIATTEGNYTIYTTLGQLEERLLGNEFVRIHRGYIIPVNRIDYIEDGTVYIQGNPLPVSENRRNGLLKHVRLL